MSRINKLSKDLINKIAAGEVIERPSSVVKELLENSIDANATKVEIRISNDCRNIRIADDGDGIHPDDIDIAFLKHTTSKINSYNDLWEISSFGFRGEALSSIMSISKLKCITKIEKCDYALKVFIDENGKLIKSKTVSNKGTIFEIEDLFYNVPARLKFLKNPKTEFSYIQEIVLQISLANPNVSINLTNDKKCVLKTLGTGDLLSTISELYSHDISDNLIEVKNKDIFTKMELDGFISKPTFERSSKKSINVYVNKRPIKCQVFSKALDLVYKNRLPKGKYPFVVLNLTIPPNDIDVNVHPAKREIRYSDPNKVFSFIFQTLNRVLENANFKEQDNIVLNINAKYKQNMDEDDVIVTQKQIEENSQITFYSLLKDNNDDRHDNNLADKSKGYYKTSKQKSEKQGEEEVLDEENNTSFIGNEDFKIIGQFLNTYIIFEEKENLYIIDQHIADERYIYNTLTNSKNISSQIILISDIFELEPLDSSFLRDNQIHFAKYGYEYIFKNDKKIIFRKIPTIISHIKLKDILSQLLELKNEQSVDLDERILINTSCKAAIKAGDSLMTWQMYNIVKNWKNTPDNLTCPHGRPIVKEFKKKDINAFFKRSNL